MNLRIKIVNFTLEAFVLTNQTILSLLEIHAYIDPLLLRNTHIQYIFTRIEPHCIQFIR